MESPRFSIVDLPEVNCGTCAHLDGTRCTPRDTVITEPPVTVCADHPHFTAGRPTEPTGPVITVAEVPCLASLSPDSPKIRQQLIEILTDVDVPSASRLSFREAAALWQLEQFDERRASVHLDRIRAGAGLAEGQFDLLEYLRVPRRTLPARLSRRFTSPRTAGTLAMIGLGAYALAGLLAIYAGVQQLGLLEQIAGGDTPVDSVLDANDEFYAMSGTLQMLCTLATAVFFLVWVHQASSNQAALGRRAEYGPGWAIGGWFVPLLNLVRPCQVVAEIQTNSAAAAGTSPATALVGCWWGTYLAWGLSSRFAASAMLRSEELAAIQGATKTYLVADALGIVAALIAALVVRRITGDQVSAHASGSSPAAARQP